MMRWKGENICQGLPNASDLSSELKLPQGETIKVTEQPGAVMIEYCKDKQCRTYYYRRPWNHSEGE